MEWLRSGLLTSHDPHSVTYTLKHFMFTWSLFFSVAFTPSVNRYRHVHRTHTYELSNEHTLTQNRSDYLHQAISISLLSFFVSEWVCVRFICFGFCAMAHILFCNDKAKQNKSKRKNKIKIDQRDSGVDGKKPTISRQFFVLLHYCSPCVRLHSRLDFRSVYGKEPISVFCVEK